MSVKMRFRFGDICYIKVPPNLSPTFAFIDGVKGKVVDWDAEIKGEISYKVRLWDGEHYVYAETGYDRFPESWLITENENDLKYEQSFY